MAIFFHMSWLGFASFNLFFLKQVSSQQLTVDVIFYEDYIQAHASATVTQKDALEDC